MALRSYAFYLSALCIALLLCAAPHAHNAATRTLPSQTEIAPDSYSTYGTLIGALGNANGIVVFTDSRASYKDATGAPHRLPGDFQKLLSFNDTTVCAIAGLGSAKVHVAHELDADLLGVVESFRDGLKDHPKQSMLSELRGLAAALTFYLDGIAEINGHTGFRADVSDYHLALLLVGLDVDGAAKIGKLALQVTPHQQADGNTRWGTSVEVLNVENIQSQLTAALTGMWDVAGEALKQPAKFRGYAILEKYRLAKNKDLGASMSLADLEELARALISLTTEKYPKQVGGARQIAILRSGQPISFDQPDFPSPKKPFPIAIFMSDSFPFQSFPSSPSIVIRGDVVAFYEETQFIGPSPESLKRGHMKLDHGIFVGCLFKNMVLWYDGGPLYFDPNNTLDNSELAFGAEAFQNPDKVRELRAIFSATHKP